MMQIIPQTKKQKLAMYMKLPKKKLAEMLIEANRFHESISQPTPVYFKDDDGYSKGTATCLKTCKDKDGIENFTPGIKYKIIDKTKTEITLLDNENITHIVTRNRWLKNFKINNVN